MAKKEIHVKGYERKRLGKKEDVSAHNKNVSSKKKVKEYKSTKGHLYTMRMSDEEMAFLKELAHYRGHSIASYFMSLATDDAQNVGVRIPKQAWNRRGHEFTPANKELNFYLEPIAKDKVYTKTENEE